MTTVESENTAPVDVPTVSVVTIEPNTTAADPVERIVIVPSFPAPELAPAVVVSGDLEKDALRESVVQAQAQANDFAEQVKALAGFRQEALNSREALARAVANADASERKIADLTREVSALRAQASTAEQQASVDADVVAKACGLAEAIAAFTG